jgi:hypothetical protein
MRKTWAVTMCLLVSIIAEAQLYWDGGGGDGQWNTGLNWSTDTVPDSTSHVVLDNRVSGNYTVMLPAGNVSTRVLSLAITPGASQLITLVLPSSNTAMIGFQAIGAGDAIVLNEGAVFRNASGASAGVPVSVISTNFFRINNGGRYIHNTQRPHTDFLVSRLSTAPGTENGIFEFDVPSTASYTISVSNRNYGHLILSANAAGGSKTYSGSGVNRFMIRGDLEINTNAVLSYGANTDTIFIQKNATVYPGAGFNISNGGNNTVVCVRGNLDIRGMLTETGSASGSVLWLNGTSQQSITVNGSILNTVDVNLDNPAGGQLLSNLSLPLRLTITQGNLVLNNHDLIVPFINQVNAATPTGNHIVTNGIGLLRMPVSDSTKFPVGPDVSHYNPVHITQGAGAQYAVRVETGINPSISNPFPAVVNRTWTIQTSLVPSNAVAMKLGFNAGDWVNSFDTELAADLGQWINDGWSIARSNLSITNTGAQPTYEVTFDNISSYNTGFIIGNRSFGLPVHFQMVCDAKITDVGATIRWRVNDQDKVLRFELQRAVTDSVFRTVTTLLPVAGKQEYVYEDPLAGNDKLLYRVKANLRTGEQRYSNTVTISRLIKGIWLRRIMPNPVVDKAILQVDAGKNERIDLRLIDRNGLVIRKWNLHVVKGYNTIELVLGDLPAGAYVLTSATAGNAILIVRQ